VRRTGWTANRGHGDGGAALVELALVAPFLFLLAFGLIDYGAAWQADTQLERMSSLAARVGASQGDAPLADFDLLQAVNGSMADLDRLELVKVIVYVPQADGSVPSACMTAASGVSGVCNVYDASQVEQTDPGVGFPRGSSTNPDCVSGSWDENWCPVDRDDEPPSLGLIGVYVEAEFQSLTGVLLSGTTQSQHAVYQIEPAVAIGDD
jgi:hypothetical protein